MLRQLLAAPSGRLLSKPLPLLLLIPVLPTSLSLPMDLAVTLVPRVDTVHRLLVDMAVLLVTDPLLQVAMDLLLRDTEVLPVMVLLLPTALLLLMVLLLPTAPLVDMVLPKVRATAATAVTATPIRMVKERRRRAAAPACFLVPQVVSLLVL
jgi:hypothetical protein